MKRSQKTPKTMYLCQACGHSSPKWLGRCSGCGEWNSMVEEKVDRKSSSSTETSSLEMHQLVGKLDEIPDRLDTGIGELNRVLGGGLVPDSFTLLGGDPGIGKSTLLLQAARGLVRSQPGLKVFYVSGEESVGQIRSRAGRLGVEGDEGIFLAAENKLESVTEVVRKERPDVLIMDSLQTFSSLDLQSAPGSVSQVREVASQLMDLAKGSGIAVWLVGHVTKEGSIAGPKVVEHMVDTVLYFEGDGGQSYRLLRAVKNRFGSSRELGVFEMVPEGLAEVTNPSSLFLNERSEPVEGTAVGVSLEGSRPILVEFQALVAGSELSFPRRTSVGMEQSKIALLAAILERHLNVPLAEQDLFFNVAGGLKLNEPACDLAASAAIWSSSQSIPLPSDTVFIGELGLTGEVRRVSLPDLRIEEAKKLGFKRVVLPQGVMDRCRSISGIELVPIQKVSQFSGILA